MLHRWLRQLLGRGVVATLLDFLGGILFYNRPAGRAAASQIMRKAGLECDHYVDKGGRAFPVRETSGNLVVKFRDSVVLEFVRVHCTVGSMFMVVAGSRLVWSVGFFVMDYNCVR